MDEHDRSKRVAETLTTKEFLRCFAVKNQPESSIKIPVNKIGLVLTSIVPLW